MTYRAMAYQGSHAVGLDGRPVISPMSLPAALWLADLLNRDVVILGCTRVSRAPQMRNPAQPEAGRNAEPPRADRLGHAAGAGFDSSINPERR
jgi:hypothetical protein